MVRKFIVEALFRKGLTSCNLPSCSCPSWLNCGIKDNLHPHKAPPLRGGGGRVSELVKKRYFFAWGSGLMVGRFHGFFNHYEL